MLLAPPVCLVNSVHFIWEHIFCIANTSTKRENTNKVHNESRHVSSALSIVGSDFVRTLHLLKKQGSTRAGQYGIVFLINYITMCVSEDITGVISSFKTQLHASYAY